MRTLLLHLSPYIHILPYCELYCTNDGLINLSRQGLCRMGHTGKDTSALHVTYILHYLQPPTRIDRKTAQRNLRLRKVVIYTSTQLLHRIHGAQLSLFLIFYRLRLKVSRYRHAQLQHTTDREEIQFVVEENSDLVLLLRLQSRFVSVLQNSASFLPIYLYNHQDIKRLLP
jgi:hypothetical protein